MPRKIAASSDVNPAIATWSGPLGLPDFAAIEDRDFGAAFAAALPAHLAEIEAIANNSEEPTFENTIVELELAGERRCQPNANQSPKCARSRVSGRQLTPFGQGS